MFRFEDTWLLSLLALIPLMIYYEWKNIGSTKILIKKAGLRTFHQRKIPYSLRTEVES